MFVCVCDVADSAACVVMVSVVVGVGLFSSVVPGGFGTIVSNYCGR